MLFSSFPYLTRQPSSTVALFDIFILTVAKLQCSGRRPRGQPFNLRLLDFAVSERSLRCFAALNMTTKQATVLRLKLLVSRHFARHRFQHPPDVFSKHFLPSRIRMNAIGPIQRRISSHAFE